jgi:hypothetical protein
MTGMDDNQRPPEWMADIEQRLRDERAQLDPLELDRVKQTALRHASNRGGAHMNLRSRLISVALAAVLVLSGGTAVYAVAGGASSKDSSSSQSQYCPKNGKPKNPDGGNMCGHP